VTCSENLKVQFQHWPRRFKLHQVFGWNQTGDPGYFRSEP